MYIIKIEYVFNKVMLTWASCSGSNNAILLETVAATSDNEPPDWRGSDGTDTEMLTILSPQKWNEDYLIARVLQGVAQEHVTTLLNSNKFEETNP